MFTRVFAPIAVASVMALSFLAPAWGATVTESSRDHTRPAVGGTAIDLKVEDFKIAADGNCGGGNSVVPGGGCGVAMRPVEGSNFGRFDPLANYWIDSQDIDKLEWTVTSPTAFTSLTFALTDAHDQAESFFHMSFFDNGSWAHLWEIEDRQANGNLYWLTVDFGKAVTEAKFLFSTKVGLGYDGYGISSLSIAPVPLPPAALLLLGSGAMLAGLKRRRKTVA